MITFMYHNKRTPNLPFTMSGLYLRWFRNDRLHAVNILSNNTVCIRIINIIRTGSTIIPGRNQYSNFPTLQRDVLREKLCLIPREHHYWLQKYP